MDAEKFIEDQAINRCLEIPRIKKLINKGRINQFEVELTSRDAVIRQRTGMQGRMRASDCITAAETAVKAKYKGLKL